MPSTLLVSTQQTALYTFFFLSKAVSIPSFNGPVNSAIMTVLEEVDQSMICGHRENMVISSGSLNGWS